MMSTIENNEWKSQKLFIHHLLLKVKIHVWDLPIMNPMKEKMTKVEPIGITKTLMLLMKIVNMISMEKFK
jgi:hypothetical protein